MMISSLLFSLLGMFISFMGFKLRFISGNFCLTNLLGFIPSYFWHERRINFFIIAIRSFC